MDWEMRKRFVLFYVSIKLTDILKGYVVKDISQVSQVCIVDVEHVKVLVRLGQVDGEALEDGVQVNVVVARAADYARTAGVLEALAGRKEVRGRARART